MRKRRSARSTGRKSAGAVSPSTKRGRKPSAAADSAVASLIGAVSRAGNVGEDSRGAFRKRAPTRPPAWSSSRPAERRGDPSTGRIVKLLIGQGHGFIRLARGREIFFHRSDVQEDTSFNDLAVGDAVTFELLDDAVSGPRALHVKRRGPQD